MSMIEVATLGAGCFWCVEALFSSLTGVVSVDVGYSNGQTDNPTYEEVCSGNTGYAEVANISFNSEIISFENILNHFFEVHDPTTLNQQGADTGTQYRSSIFYHSESQKKTAFKLLDKYNSPSYYNGKIVTEIEEAKNFYIAEDYHQNYYENNKTAPYCMFVIKPKLDKLNK